MNTRRAQLARRISLTLHAMILGSAVCSAATSPSHHVRIGVMSVSNSTEGSMRAAAVLVARDYIQQRLGLLSDVSLDIIFSESPSSVDGFLNIQHVCHLIEQGSSVIIGPSTTAATTATEPVCSSLHIPQITPSATDPALSRHRARYPYLLKMSAPDNIQGNALLKLFKLYAWTRLSMLMSSTDYGTDAVHQFITDAGARKWELVNVQVFDAPQNPALLDASAQLQVIRNSSVHVIVLSCLALYAWPVLKQAEKYGLLEAGYAWIVLDGVTASSLQPVLKRMHPDSCGCNKVVPVAVQGLLGTVPAYGRGALYADALQFWQSNPLYGMNTSPSPYAFRFFDAMLTLAYALNEYFADGHTLSATHFGKGVCMGNYTEPWKDGNVLLQYLEKAEGDGTMNYLQFNELRYPTVAAYDIVNLHEQMWIKVSEWFATENNDLTVMRRVVFPGQTHEVPTGDLTGMPSTKLRIVTLLEDPFMMPNPGDPSDPYRGFGIDFIKGLQQILGFDYELHLVNDGRYGTLNEDTMEWDGMIRELIDDKADIAVSTLFISKQRVSYVDMTMPYLDLGLGILLPTESQDKAKGILAHFHPFEYSLWGVIMVATCFCGVMVTLCSFFSPYGYRGRYIQRLYTKDQRYKAHKSKLNYHHGFWFSLTSIMEQGPVVKPISASGRTVAMFWWFTAMIMVASYTANLTAFLTVERISTAINTLRDLAGQTEVKYGTVEATAISEFFDSQEEPPLSTMRHHMNAYGTSVKNASEGIERVRQSYYGTGSAYAFIYDSVILEYAMYKGPCELRLLPEQFKPDGYSLALAKNSAYTATFQRAILAMRENGDIQKIKDFWISGPCTDMREGGSKYEEITSQQMTLYDMAGVFVVLLFGIGLAIVALVVEFFVASYMDTVLEQKRGSLQHSWGWHLRRRLVDVKEDLIRTFCSCDSIRGAYALREHAQDSTKRNTGKYRFARRSCRECVTAGEIEVRGSCQRSISVPAPPETEESQHLPGRHSLFPPTDFDHVDRNIPNADYGDAVVSHL